MNKKINNQKDKYLKYSSIKWKYFSLLNSPQKKLQDKLHSKIIIPFSVMATSQPTNGILFNNFLCPVKQSSFISLIYFFRIFSPVICVF